MRKTVWIKGFQTPVPHPAWPVVYISLEQQTFGVRNWRAFVLTLCLRTYRLPPAWMLKAEFSWERRR